MKKLFLRMMVTGVLMTVSPVEAQHPATIRKIGWLGTRPANDRGSGYEILRRELRALGYVEGKNITFKYRSAENKIDRLPALADELVRLKVDVLVAAGGIDAVTAKKATTTIPVDFVTVPDPIGSGLIDSLAHPGGNMTGVTSIAVELAGKRLELLKETIPKLTRVAVLWNPQDPTSAPSWKESQLPGRELGLQLYSMEVSSPGKLDSAFRGAIKARSSALIVNSSSLFGSYQKQIADLAAKNRMPAIYAREDYVDSGGLMSYGRDREEPYKRAAVYVDKILKGAKPADLPVEQPTRLEFIINLKAAKQIGLTIPPNVLVRADRVIR